MSNNLYRNSEMEQELLSKINDRANKRFDGNIPPDIQKRIAAETQHIINSGHGILLAIAASLAQFSAARGYPISIRGPIHNLYVAFLLGITANDPLELGLHWESCLGPDGSQMPEVVLHAANEVLDDLRAHLRELLPDCDVLFGLPATTTWGVVIIPKSSGAYGPANKYPCLKLYPGELMSRMGQARQQAGSGSASEVIFDEDLIASVYLMDMTGVPELDRRNDFLDLACALEPKTFPDMVKVMGLSLAPEIWDKADHLMGRPDRFDHLIGTQEDVYDLCVRHGVGGEDAFHIMQRVGHHGFGRLTYECRNMLAAHGLCGLSWDTLHAVKHLPPRGQCADDLYWELTLLALERRGCRV